MRSDPAADAAHLSAPFALRRRRLAALALAPRLGSRDALAQPTPRRLAWLSSTDAADGAIFIDEFRRGLRERGWIEARNLVIQARWLDGRRDRIEPVIDELLAWKPDVIATQGAAARFVRLATETIPVVFGSGDPVEAGLVASLARPGRNMTGISFMTTDLVGKRIELLKELAPKARRIAVVADPQHAGHSIERSVAEAAARSQGLEFAYHECRDRAELFATLAAIERAGSELVLFFPVALVIAERIAIAQWSLRHRIPTVSGWAQFARSALGRCGGGSRPLRNARWRSGPRGCSAPASGPGSGRCERSARPGTFRAGGGAARPRVSGRCRQAMP